MKELLENSCRQYKLNLFNCYKLLKELEELTTRDIMEILNVKKSTAYFWANGLVKYGLACKELKREKGGRYNLYKCSFFGKAVSLSDVRNVSEITPREFETLEYVSEGLATSYDICKKTSRDSSHISRELQNLEKWGYVESEWVESKGGILFFSLNPEITIKNIENTDIREFLEFIEEEGETSIKETVKKMGLSRTGIRDRLKRLAKNGYLNVRKEKGKREYRTTEKGERTIAFGPIKISWFLEEPELVKLIQYPRVLRLEKAATNCNRIKNLEELINPYQNFCLGRNAGRDPSISRKLLERVQKTFIELKKPDYEYWMKLGILIGYTEIEMVPTFLEIMEKNIEELELEKLEKALEI